MKIYTPRDVDAMNIYEVRQTYAQMRKAANKRIRNIAKHGTITTKTSSRKGKSTPTSGIRFSDAVPGSKLYQFPAASTLTNEQVRAALADISMWIRNPSHTVKGEAREREFRLSLLKKKYPFVTNENFYQFTNFMEDLRQQYSDKVFDSSAAADVFEQVQRINLPLDVVKKNFDYYAEHLKELDDMKPIRSNYGMTHAGMKDKIRKLSKR